MMTESYDSLVLRRVHARVAHKRRGYQRLASTTLLLLRALSFLLRTSTCTCFSNSGLRALEPSLREAVFHNASLNKLLSGREHTTENLADAISDETQPMETGSMTPTKPPSSEFGQSIELLSLKQSNLPLNSMRNLNFTSLDDEVELLKRNRLRNIVVSAASFTIAIFNYIWQFTHPVTALELLATMQSQSAPLTAIGHNGKPTVIDFWAPWCENCKAAAPTLKAVEQEYADRVNFILINGDDGQNWPLIQLFGVDAIPHMALLSNEGDVETALIGPMSRNVLRADIEALLKVTDDCEKSSVSTVSAPLCHEILPYQMFDAFRNMPANRRINFVEP